MSSKVGTRIEAVIFDWNGTLYDDLEPLAYASVVEIFKTYNLAPPTLDEYRQEVTSKFMDFYYGHGFIPNFSGQGSDGDARALNNIRKKFYTDNRSKGRVRVDATRTVLNLGVMRIKIGIVSAEIESLLFERLYSSDLHKLVDSRFIKTQVWDGKGPALLEVCEKLGIAPKNTVYVDDTVDGTSAAKKAGLIPVGFSNRTGYNSGERLLSVTPFLAHELSDLIEFVQRPTLIKE